VSSYGSSKVIKRILQKKLTKRASDEDLSLSQMSHFYGEASNSRTGEAL